ncbi:epimerase [Elizabethkingia anophelis]|nr:epimerase [Elizabethkingia anophelis]MDV3842078.1 epimerase [Elizabethkingia anophelis]
MNITIIGASAGVGLDTVKRALERGHTVKTLSRSKINLPENNRLKMQQGSATNRSDLEKSIENADAVIVAIGTGSSTKATTLFSETARLLTAIQSKYNTSIPFIILTGFGAGESSNYVGFFGKLIFKFILKDIYVDKTKMEKIITSSDMNWEIVRPGMLKNNSLTEKYRIEIKLYRNIKPTSINRADVADFMVKQAENPTLLKKCVSIFNK